jgi:hypothetical protein
MMENSPESYFKYRPLWQGDKDMRIPHVGTARIFRNRELWYATPSSFNDPFDCNLLLHVRDSTDEDWVEYYSTIARDNPEMATQISKIIDGRNWNNHPEIADEILKSNHNKNYNKSSVLCLAKRGDSVPMFSYYADSHRGIALEFRFAKNEVPCGLDYDNASFSGINYEGKLVLGNVEYSDKFPELNYHRIRGSDLVRALLFTKLGDWKHEEEYRIFRRGVEASAVTFDDRLLTRVIFGCRAEEDEVVLVRDYLRGWQTRVILTRATQETDRFGLKLEDFETVGGV